MLTPIQQLPLTEAQRQTALNHHILALDLDCTALLHQPERGSGVYVLDQYAQPRGAAVTCSLLLALHLNGTCPRRWSFLQPPRRRCAPASREPAPFLLA